MVEIRPEDIVKKPERLKSVVTGSAPMDFIKQVKEYLGQAKAIKKELADLGINLGNLDLGGIMGGQKGGQAPADAPGPQGSISKENVGNFLRLLMARYGDLPLTEMLGKMQKEFGPVKLSSFLQLFLGPGSGK